MESDAEKKIIVYGTNWCGESRRARRMFDDNQIPYTWVDIDTDLEGRKYVEQVNRGFRSVPTIVFPDGSLLVEPTSTELMKKLGLI